MFDRRSFWLVAPYAAWMAFMAFLPACAWAYAVRGLVTALLVAVAYLQLRPAHIVPAVSRLAAGLAVGLAVFVIWIAPETFLPQIFPAPSDAGSPYAPDVCGWPLTLAKLAASAFVIPIAEELFFRRWLLAFAGFWWMVALFAVEHGDRWAVGAVAGVAYGLLARRLGLAAAIVAHMTTNLVLGIWVILRGVWGFW